MRLDRVPTRPPPKGHDTIRGGTNSRVRRGTETAAVVRLKVLRGKAANKRPKDLVMKPSARFLGVRREQPDGPSRQVRQKGAHESKPPRRQLNPIGAVVRGHLMVSRDKEQHRAQQARKGSTHGNHAARPVRPEKEQHGEQKLGTTDRLV